MLMEEENRRLLQYAKEQQEREAERMAQEKKSEETKTLVYQKVRLIIHTLQLHYKQLQLLS